MWACFRDLMETLQRKCKTSRQSQGTARCSVQVFYFSAQSGLFSTSLQANFSWRRFRGDLWATFPDVSCTRQASGFLGSFNDNTFRQRKVKEPPGTFKNFLQWLIRGNTQAFSVSLGVSCQPSGILQTTFQHLGCCGEILSTTGLGAV